MIRPRITWAILLAVAPIPAAADDKKDGDAVDPAYHTVVRGRAVEHKRPRDDPAGFSTVLQIKQPPAGTGLEQLLERVPGLRVRDSGPGGRKVLSLRGTDAHQAAVFLDGVRLSSASGGVDLSLLDPAHLEQVEVRRGGGSARFGSNALGGVLSLSTPRLKTRPRTRASLSYGSFHQVAARASRSAGLGRKFRYLASGSYRRSDGDFGYVHHLNGTSHVRSNNDSQMGELLLKTDYLASHRWQLGLLNDLALGERGAPGVLDNECLTARQQDLRNLTALSATARDLAQQGSRLELVLSHRLGQFHYRDPCELNLPSRTRGHTAAFSARWGVPLPRTGRVDLGLELQEDLLLDLQGNLADKLTSRFSAGLYASSTLRLLRRHLVLVPAVRLAAASAQSTAVMPKLGLVLHPLRWTKHRWLTPLAIAGNLGRSFRHPSFHELYINMDSLQGNAELEPEDALEGDVGLRWANKVIALELAYFRRQIKNLILYKVHLYKVIAGNSGRATTDGLELSLKARPGWGLSLTGSYSYTRTRWGDPPKRLPGHPEHRVVARGQWRYPFKADPSRRWEVKLWSAVTFESDMPLDQHNMVLMESRVLLSAGASTRYRWLSLAASGSNLLNRRDLLDSLGFPLPPARFLLSLSAAL